MKLLIVSYHFYPALIPPAIRWKALGEHWTRLGHEVRVVSGWAPGLPREERVGGMRVRRVGGLFRETLRGWLRGPNGAGEGRGGPSSWLKRLHDATWKRVYWPDFASLWSIPAFREARRLMREGCDALVTVSHPFTPHLVGLALKRASPAVPWVADMGDPFCLLEDASLNNLALYRSLAR